MEIYAKVNMLNHEIKEANNQSNVSMKQEQFMQE